MSWNGYEVTFNSLIIVRVDRWPGKLKKNKCLLWPQCHESRLLVIKTKSSYVFMELYFLWTSFLMNSDPKVLKPRSIESPPKKYTNWSDKSLRMTKMHWLSRDLFWDWKLPETQIAVRFCSQCIRNNSVNSCVNSWYKVDKWNNASEIKVITSFVRHLGVTLWVTSYAVLS